MQERVLGAKAYTNSMNSSSILIIGTGNLGCTLAVIAATAGMSVQMWADKNHRSTFNKICQNGGLRSRGLVEAEASPVLVTDLSKALQDSSLVILTLPSSGRSDFINEAAGFFNEQHTLVVIPGKHFAFGVDANKKISPRFIVEIGNSPYATKLDLDSNHVVANIKASKEKLDIAIYQKLAAELGPNGDEDLLQKDLDALPTDMIRMLLPHSSLVERPLLELNLHDTGAVLHSVASVANIDRILRKEVFYFYRDGMAKTPGVTEMQQKISDVKADIANSGGWQYIGLLELCNLFYSSTMGRSWVSIKDHVETSPIHNTAPGMPTNTEHRYLTEELPELLKNAAYGHALGVDVSPILEVLSDADKKMPNKLHLMNKFHSGTALQELGMAGLSKSAFCAKYGPNGWLMPKYKLFSK